MRVGVKFRSEKWPWDEGGRWDESNLGPSRLCLGCAKWPKVADAGYAGFVPPSSPRRGSPKSAQGQPSDAVAMAPPWVDGIEMAVESWIVHAIAGLPRPQQAASCFGLGRLAIGWWPVLSAEAIHGFSTQGGVILA